MGARAPTRLLVRGATASACRVSRAKKSPSPMSMLPIPHNILLQESQEGCPTSAAWLRMAPIGSWTVKASDPQHSRGRTADVQVILLSSSCLGIPENPDNRTACKLVAWRAKKILQFSLHRAVSQCQSGPTNQRTPHAGPAPHLVHIHLYSKPSSQQPIASSRWEPGESEMELDTGHN